jgi:hypothetical protein
VAAVAVLVLEMLFPRNGQAVLVLAAVLIYLLALPHLLLVQLKALSSVLPEPRELVLQLMPLLAVLAVLAVIVRSQSLPQQVETLEQEVFLAAASLAALARVVGLWVRREWLLQQEELALLVQEVV